MLPSLKRIQKEDMPDAPDWMHQAVTIINNFFQNVYSLLNRNLTLQDNIRCELKEFSIRAPIDGFIFPTKIIPATGILMLGITGTTFTGAVAMRAHADQANVIIDNISGLTSGEVYKVRILIV